MSDPKQLTCAGLGGFEFPWRLNFPPVLISEKKKEHCQRERPFKVLTFRGKSMAHM